MTSGELRILVIDRNKVRASIIEEGLRDHGHAQVTVVSDMTHMLRCVVDAAPDVIIMDLENPNRDMLEHALQVSRAVRKPIAMFVDRTDAEATSAAIEAGVSAYVIDGLRKERIKPVLDMAITRFKAAERLREELMQTQNRLAERKTIDRAKALLMKHRGLDEDAAYQLLRKTAMNQSRRIAQVAESVLLAAELFDRGDKS